MKRLLILLLTSFMLVGVMFGANPGTCHGCKKIQVGVAEFQCCSCFSDTTTTQAEVEDDCDDYCPPALARYGAACIILAMMIFMSLLYWSETSSIFANHPWLISSVVSAMFIFAIVGIGLVVYGLSY